MDGLRLYLVRNWRWFLWLGFPLVSLGMHLHLLNLPLQGIHAWRQCETASNVALFAEGDPNILNPHVFSLEWDGGLKRMEFPIMQWVFSVFYRVFGAHVVILRILSWLMGFFAVIGFFRLIDHLMRDKFLALLAAWCWMFSPEIFYYSINPLPDNLALMAGVWGLAFFMRWYRSERMLDMVVSYGFLSLSVAAKLPFIVLFAVPFGWALRELVVNRGKTILQQLKMVLPGIMILAPALMWYVWVIPQWTGNGIVKGVLESSAHDIPALFGIFWGNLVSIFPELLLNYAALPIFLMGTLSIFSKKLYRHPLAMPFGLMLLGVVAYFVFEINMITTIHDYYLFPFLPGIFILVAIGFKPMWEVRWMRALLVILLFVLPITAGIRCYVRWELKGMPADLVVHGENLRNAVPKVARIIYGNDFSPHISLYHLHHFGWTMHEKEFNAEKFRLWLEKGARYFYCNSRSLEANEVVAPHLGNLIGEWGKTRVWELGN